MENSTPADQQVSSTSEPRSVLLGPDSQYVKFVSNDGIGIFVKREYAMQSLTIEGMVSGPGATADGCETSIDMPIASTILLKFVDYLIYRYIFKDTKDSAELPVFDIPKDMACDLLMAAHFFQM